MRAGIVFFSVMNRERILSLVRSLARGIEAQGHQVDIIDGNHDIQAKLTMYQYIAIGTETLSNLSSKIPGKIGQFLGASGMIAGKRCFAFVTKNLFGSGKALSRLMKLMEQEGMFIKNSLVLNSTAEAEEVGKKLQIH